MVPKLNVLSKSLIAVVAAISLALAFVRDFDVFLKMLVRPELCLTLGTDAGLVLLCTVFAHMSSEIGFASETGCAK